MTRFVCFDRDARLAILFSGGVDCAFITHLANAYIPEGEPIDLLNVAFENPRAIANATRERAEKHRLAAKRKPKGQEKATDVNSTEEVCAGIYDVPDRLTGRETVAELRRIHSNREWRFVEIDVEYQVSFCQVLDPRISWEQDAYSVLTRWSLHQECQATRSKVLDLMYPSDTGKWHWASFHTVPLTLSNFAFRNGSRKHIQVNGNDECPLIPPDVEPSAAALVRSETQRFLTQVV